MALKSFREMQREVLRRISNVNFSTTNADDLLPKVSDWINSRYREVTRFRPWDETVFKQSLQIVASTSDYVLDRKTERIWSAFDTTNGRVINEIDVNEHIRNNATSFDNTNSTYTADPLEFYSIGTKTVEGTTGSTAEKISVVSSSASDVSPLVVHVKGEVSGVEVEEDIIITGTSAASSANTYSASQYISVSLGTNDGSVPAAVGVITVSGATSGNTISKLTKFEQAPQYKWITVAPTPRASGTQPLWAIWANLRINNLVDNNDIPIFDCCDEIIYGAYADALREDGQENEANVAEQKFVSMVTALWNSKRNTKNFFQMIPSGRDRFTVGDFGRTLYVR